MPAIFGHKLIKSPPGGGSTEVLMQDLSQPIIRHLEVKDLLISTAGT